MDTTKAEFKVSYGLSSQLPERDRAEIVFSGRSNVGKSSLINKLCNRKSLARVSSTPGKTATINFHRRRWGHGGCPAAAPAAHIAVRARNSC